MVDAVLLDYRRIWDLALRNLCRQDSRGKRGHYQEEEHDKCKDILSDDNVQQNSYCQENISDVLKSFC
mgnify:CR=1 FL=1